MFLSKVQKLREELNDEYDLDWTDDMRLTHVVAELSNSNIFTEEEMMNWEENPKVDCTYVAMVAYFTIFLTSTPGTAM